MSELQKICILSFDEMKIRKAYCYDKVTDSTLLPASYVQVGMIRGLVANWKQPIFFDFDCQMTPDILKTILSATKECGFTVVAMVSDLGGSNRALFNELKVDAEKPWFTCDSNKIYVLADVPHLIKLLRNHFLDRGFVINGKLVQKDIVVDLLACTSADLTITHKISSKHLQVTGCERQNVKMATKLFSHTIAQAITRAASMGYLKDKNWEECFELFKTTNNWFDVMNVRVPNRDTRERTHGYGLALQVQDDIIGKMSNLIKNMRVKDKRTLLPLQKGIIQSNNALKLLYIELKERFDIKYILTYHLNQDVLENFFGIIRSKGGLHDHPDRQEFKYRLRSYLLDCNKGVLSTSANVEEDNTQDLDRFQNSLTGLIFSNICESAQLDVNIDNDLEQLEGLEYDGLENLAGYICHRLKEEIPNISVKSSEDTNFTWVSHLNEGGLSKPTEEVMQQIIELEQIFKSINEDSLFVTSDYLKLHIEKASHISCNIKIKKLFFRARMFFVMRKLNREI